MNRPLAVLLLAAAALPACKSEVVCTSTEVAHDGQCISLSSDPANCGAIGRACAAGETCTGGLCCDGATCPPAAYAACFNGNAVQGITADVVPVGAPVHTDSGPISLAWQGSALWAASSLSSTLDRMTVSPAGLVAAGPTPPLALPGGAFFDLEYVAERDGLLYVSNAAVGSLVVVDPAALSVRGAVELGTMSYPQGIAFSGTKAFVALNGTSALAVVDLGTSTSTTVDLSGLASPGHLALPSRLAVVGNRVYVTLWNLDTSWANPGHGLLAVVDAATGALVPGVNPVDLGAACQDPAALALLGDTLWVTCGWFPWNATGTSDITGAALVPVDVSGAAPAVGAPVPVSGAAPGPIGFCGGVGYVGDRFSGDVLRFHPASRTVTARGLACPATGGGSTFVADVACGR